MFPGYELAKRVRNEVLLNGFEAGAQLVVDKHGKKPVKVLPGQGVAILYKWFKWLLEHDYYEAAGTLQWGTSQFDVRPRCTREILGLLKSSAKCSVIGGGSMSKSYTAICWCVLDYLADPKYTSIKVISSAKGHAAANIYSHAVRLLQNSLIPVIDILDLTVSGTYIGLDPLQKNVGFELVAIPPGSNGKGRLRGRVKPFNRAKAHPKYGIMSRTRVLLDEAEEIPEGVWEDVDNVLLNMDGPDTVKVFAATNPKDRSSEHGKLTEPIDGWESIRIESSYFWKSRKGWHCLRLDGMTCENVIEGKIIYPSLMTRTGAMEIINAPGGTESPAYFTMLRGWYPPGGVAGSIISETVLQGAIGDYIWADRPTPIASLDVALEGGDRPEMTIGRCGRAVALRFPDNRQLKFPIPIFAAQVDRQIELAKGPTLQIARECRKKCEMFNVKPAQLTMDRTGNGAGVHDFLLDDWSKDVRGIDFATAATERYILKEDTKFASDMYDGIVSELWFALQKWLEYKYLKFSASMNTNDLFGELISRKYTQGNQKRLRVEPKSEHKKKLGRSPDLSDSLTLFVDAARNEADATPTMQPEKPPEEERNFGLLDHGVVDKVEFIDFNS